MSIVPFLPLESIPNQSPGLHKHRTRNLAPNFPRRRTRADVTASRWYQSVAGSQWWRLL